MLADQKTTRQAFDAEMAKLATERTAAHRTLSDLREALGEALGILPAETEEPAVVETADEAAPVAEDEAETVDSDETAGKTELDDGPPTEAHSPVPAGSDDDEEYEEKLEAWVNWSSGDNGVAH